MNYGTNDAAYEAEYEAKRAAKEDGTVVGELEQLENVLNRLHKAVASLGASLDAVSSQVVPMAEELSAVRAIPKCAIAERVAGLRDEASQVLRRVSSIETCLALS